MFFNEECFIRFWSKDEAKTQMQKFRRALLINTTNQKQTKQLHGGKHSNNADTKTNKNKADQSDSTLTCSVIWSLLMFSKP